MYRYAIIGFGGLGKKHLSNLVKLESKRGDIKLCAICGADIKSFKENVKLNLGSVDISNIDFSDCSFYEDYKELIDTEKPDFILSTVPTYLHKEICVYALNRGVHVFSEKPMALSLSDCADMINASKTNNKKLMIGQCLRFDPAYTKLKEYIDNQTFGKAYRAEFTRYSQKPAWTWKNWILAPKLSGGCPIDMHIHDVDLINWFFGKPNSLRSAITEKKAELESVFTQMFYDELLVIANADWSMTQTFPFEARCLVNFETATVILEDGKITVYKDDESFSPNLPENDCFTEEIETLLKLIIDDEPTSVTSPESVMSSVEIALAEIKSAKEKKEISF